MAELTPKKSSDEGIAPPPAPEDVAAMFDLSKKKKKKKVKKEVKEEQEDEEHGENETTIITSSTGVLVQDPATYSYKDDLLARIMSKLHENNPELSDRKRHTMKPPQLMRSTCFLSFSLVYPHSHVCISSRYKENFVG